MPERLVNTAFQFAPCRVEVVLDAIVAAALHLLRYLGPLVAKPLVLGKDELFLFFRDWVFLDQRVQVIVPPNPTARLKRLNIYLPLATLLTRASSDLVRIVELSRDEGPSLRPTQLHKLHDCIVLLQPGLMILLDS